MLMGDWELPFAAGAVSPQVSGPAGEMKSEVCIYAAQCIFQEKFITQAINWKFCSTYVLLGDKYSLQETPSILLMRFLIWFINITKCCGMKPYLFLHEVLLVLDFYSNLCSSSQNHYVGCLKSTLLFDTIALQLGCRIFLVQRFMLTFFSNIFFQWITFQS